MSRRSRKRQRGRSKAGIERINGPHRFDTYGEYSRVAGCVKKVRYETEDAAIAAAIRVSCNCGHPMRPYRCDRCHGWHISSKVGGRV